MGRFQDQSAIVTGAASGIGLAIALRLASEGAKLVIADLNTVAIDKAVDAVKRAGAPDAVGAICDVSDEAAVQAAVLTITDDQNDWAIEVRDRLRARGLRVEADVRSQKVGYKIREHTLKKVPWLLIVGDQEKREGAVSPRDCSGKTYGMVPVEQFIDRLLEETNQH